MAHKGLKFIKNLVAGVCIATGIYAGVGTVHQYGPALYQEYINSQTQSYQKSSKTKNENPLRRKKTPSEIEEILVNGKKIENSESNRFLYSPEIELDEKTKILSGMALENIDFVGEYDISFKHPIKYDVGDILVAGISDKTPKGFLKEVKKVSNTNKKVWTKNSNLEDAIENADFLMEISPPSGKYNWEVGDEIVQEVHKYNSLNVSNSVKHWQSKKRGDDLTGKIEINSKWDLHANNYLGCKIEDNQLKRLVNISQIKLSCEGKLQTIGRTNFSDKRNIANYNFSPFVIPLGSFPIVIVPELNVFLNKQGRVSKSEASANSNINFSSRIDYSNGNWKLKKEIKKDFKHDLDIRPEEMGFSFDIIPELSFSLYGIVGPYVNGSVGLEISAEDKGERGSLSKNLESLIGIKSNVFSDEIPSYERQIFSDSEVIFGWGGKRLEKLFYRTITNSGEPRSLYRINEDGRGKKCVFGPEKWPIPIYSVSPKGKYFSVTQRGNQIKIFYNKESPEVRKILSENIFRFTWRGDNEEEILTLKSIGNKYPPKFSLEETNLINGEIKRIKENLGMSSFFRGPEDYVVLKDEERGVDVLTPENKIKNILGRGEIRQIIPSSRKGVYYTLIQKINNSKARVNVVYSSFDGSRRNVLLEKIIGKESINLIPQVFGEFQDRNILMGNMQKIQISDPRGQTIRDLSEDLDLGLVGEAKISPKGDKIAFIMGDSKEINKLTDFDIYVYDLNKGNLSNLTNTPKDAEIDMTWSPN